MLTALEDLSNIFNSNKLNANAGKYVPLFWQVNGSKCFKLYKVHTIADFVLNQLKQDIEKFV